MTSDVDKSRDITPSIAAIHRYEGDGRIRLPAEDAVSILGLHARLITERGNPPGKQLLREIMNAERQAHFEQPIDVDSAIAKQAIKAIELDLEI